MKRNKLRFTAGVLAAFLVLNGIGSQSLTVYAENVENSQCFYGTLDDQIDPDRISYAQVDMSCFTNSALDYVDEYVALNDDGDFYITDSESLKNLLTSEQFALVEEQIEAVNSAVTLYAATGTEQNPYELTAGVKASVTTASSEYWFSCTIHGATDFFIQSTVIANWMTIYKKQLFGKQQVHITGNTTACSYMLSDCAINNGANKYLVVIEPRFSSTVSAKISQHQDSNDSYLSNGAIWKPDDRSAVPDTNILYQRYWYVPKESVLILYEYILHDKFLDYQQGIISGTLTAVSVATSLFPNQVATAAGIIASCAGMFVPNEKEDLLKELSKAAKFDGKAYTSGVLLYEYMYTPEALTFYKVESWDGDTMYGPNGWTGTWDSN